MWIKPHVFRLYGSNRVIYTDIAGIVEDCGGLCKGRRGGVGVLVLTTTRTSTPHHYKVLKIKRYPSNYIKPLLDSFSN